MLKVMGIDLFKRKVISWFFKPERDGWFVDEKAIDEDTIQHKVFHGDGEIMANYKIKKGQSTEFTFATGFNTFINAEINGWSWFGPIDDREYETSFTMRFGSKSFEVECKVTADEMIETNWIDKTPTIITYERVQPS